MDTDTPVTSLSSLSVPSASSADSSSSSSSASTLTTTITTSSSSSSSSSKPQASANTTWRPPKQNKFTQRRERAGGVGSSPSTLSSSSSSSTTDDVTMDSTAKKFPPPDSDSEDENTDGKPLQPKNTYAIIFGYVGAQYQGLQKNPGALTIESVLEDALHAAGYISAKNYGTLAKVSWTRAARTDKGVHALGQVVSLRMRIGMNNEAKQELFHKVHEHLPKDIRIFDLVKVTAQFNAKNHCSGRLYGYLLPTFTLQDRCMVNYIAKDAPMSEALKRMLNTKKDTPSSTNENGTEYDMYQTGEAQMKGRQEEWSRGAEAIKHRMKNSTEPFFTDGRYLVHGYPLSHPSSSTSLSSDSSSTSSSSTSSISHLTTTSSSFAPLPLDDYQTGAAFVRAHQSLWTTVQAQAAINRQSGYRIPATKLQMLQNLLKQYEGTHSFHNFSPRLLYGDATCARYITECSVSKPFIVGTGKDALEYVHITIAGQSFLYNQIRHMVGLAVDIVRSAAPVFAIDLAFSAGMVKLPLAPAEGLYLQRCLFKSYERTFRTHRIELSVPSTEAAQRIDDFQHNVLFKHMHHTMEHDLPFHKYIEELSVNPLNYRYRPPQFVIRDPKMLAKELGKMNTKGKDTTAGTKRRQPDDLDNGQDDNDDNVDNEEHDNTGPKRSVSRYDIDSFLAPAELPTAGAVSRIAIEKAKYKQQLREKNRSNRNYEIARIVTITNGSTTETNHDSNTVLDNGTSSSTSTTVTNATTLTSNAAPRSSPTINKPAKTQVWRPPTTKRAHVHVPKAADAPLS